MTKWYYRVIDEDGNIKSSSLETPNDKASDVARVLENLYGDVLTLTRVEEVTAPVKEPIKPKKKFIINPIFYFATQGLTSY